VHAECIGPIGNNHRRYLCKAGSAATTNPKVFRAQIDTGSTSKKLPRIFTRDLLCAKCR
ncbi:uncharacterized protein METZ01_LOCUS179796, partial [marine metagenome]